MKIYNPFKTKKALIINPYSTYLITFPFLGFGKVVKTETYLKGQHFNTIMIDEVTKEVNKKWLKKKN
jgi:hypothetical protein